MAPELGGDISALLDASLQAAGAMPQHSEVRQKVGMRAPPRAQLRRLTARWLPAWPRPCLRRSPT